MIKKKEEYALIEVGTITNKGNTIARYDKASAEPPHHFNDLNLQHRSMKKGFQKEYQNYYKMFLSFYQTQVQS